MFALVHYCLVVRRKRLSGRAFVMNLGLIVFFLGYAFVFNWVFDHLFGLPHRPWRRW